ncbi:MAG TPA: DUF2520 domain-containing protein [Bacillota bacterium]|nr:DUF2520 domain-containing protein [Bacillota bacterium]HOA15050.1 DUF2520 domain-containing protein [Bacillota bacterium]HOG52397.1 DUF2520 domain-containing protein [Bacillota bacterium]
MVRKPKDGIGAAKRAAIVGCGRVGTALAVSLCRAGYGVSILWSRDSCKAARIAVDCGAKGASSLAEAAAGADLVFLSVIDSVIGKVAGDMAAELTGSDLTGKCFYHMSGALPSSILDPLRAMGGSAASLHPLQTFPDVEMAIKTLPGSLFCAEGDEAAVSEAEDVVRAMGGRFSRIESAMKGLYHASAVMASPLLMALVATAAEGMRACGLDMELAREGLSRLSAATVEAFVKLGPELGLTGPFVRGDALTVEHNLSAMKQYCPGMLPVYLQLAEKDLEIAEKAGTDPSRLDEIRKVMEVYRDGLHSGQTG